MMNYVALIADIKGSRKLAPVGRNEAQNRIRGLVAHLNRTYHQALAAEFAITIGDEIQGLVSGLGALPSMLWDIHINTRPTTLHVGLGRGALSLPLQRVALDVDGPAFHRAREALDEAKKGQGWEIFAGFGERNDKILTGIAAALFGIRRRLTARQVEVASARRRGLTGVAVAQELGITRQAVSLYRRNSSFDAYTACEQSLRMLLEHHAEVAAA